MLVRRMHRGRLVAAGVVVIAALAGAGCSKPPSQHQALPSASTAVSPSPTPTPAPTAPGHTAPLTGLATTSATAARPAIAVMVGVVPGGPAPYGLGAADVVYSEYPEGGLVRFVSVFQSHDATAVGPVTTTRPADPKLLGVLHGCAAFGGGTSGFVRQFAPVGVCELSATSYPSLFPFHAPGNQYTSTPALFRAAPRGLRPPPGVVPFATAAQPLASSGRAVAHRLLVAIPGRATQTWSYDSRAALWRSSVGGAAVAASTVEVLVMPYHAIVIHHPLGTIQSASVLGSGLAAVVSGAFGVRGSWYRPSAKTLANVVDGSKQVVHPNRGTIWIMLAPSGTTATFS